MRLALAVLALSALTVTPRLAAAGDDLPLPGRDVGLRLPTPLRPLAAKVQRDGKTVELKLTPNGDHFEYVLGDTKGVLTAEESKAIAVKELDARINGPKGAEAVAAQNAPTSVTVDPDGMNFHARDRPEP